jgi:hypothetical protein
MTSSEANPDYWRPHYDDEAGPLKVMLRRALNFCLAPGETTLDFDKFTIDTIRRVGIPETAPIYDVGCGGELRFLRSLTGSGHAGPLVGFEPNTAQISAATWEPGEPDPRLEALLSSGDTEGIDAFFERFQSNIPRYAKLGRITLIETIANYLPVPSKSAGATTSMFAAYAIPKEKQPAAFREMARTVADDGIQPTALSHDGNKSGIRTEEEQIGKALTKITGEPVENPTPIKAGLSTEGGLELMADIWPYVYVFENRRKICINTPLRAMAYRLAHYTTSDLYMVGKGDHRRPATSKEYAEALEEIVGKKIAQAGIKDDGTGGVITDVLRQGLIVGARRELDLPEFELIKSGA